MKAQISHSNSQRPSVYQEQPTTSKLSLTLTQGHLHGEHGSWKDVVVGMGEHSKMHTGVLTCCLLFGIYGSSVDTWNMSSKSLYVV